MWHVTPLIVADLKSAFLHQYAKQLPSDEDAARRKLFNGDYSMAKSGSYMSYELAFKGVKRDLPKMHTSDAIYWFLHGLSPLLKSTCAVQPVSNKDWDDLDALMLFAEGEAIRLEMNKPATAPHAHVNAALGVKNKHISKLRKQLKKSKSPTAAAALACQAFGVKSTAAAALNALASAAE